ncbi:MAG TPA: DUF366 family protein [bacterium]|nr:DUF366 family protein [Myxococcales bacterium]OQA60920.1 MAG: hypothetical protein BWY40_00818 [bacterium ADurb.Bin270]HPW44787.1 DUF366 family protein [bacterium]HQG12798.1 DUF366 family protein [bacterium]
MIKTKWIDRELKYDGLQLCSSFIRNETGIEGDAIVAFIGPADVPIEHMVDLEDVATNAPIFSRSMLHFIVAHSSRDLALAVARQRLLVSIAADELRAMTKGYPIERVGDDIMDGEYKISVSIATLSPSSSLIHFAMNIISVGTPVKTRGLADYSVDPKKIGESILTKYANEIHTMQHAVEKVRFVD